MKHSQLMIMWYVYSNLVLLGAALAACAMPTRLSTQALEAMRRGDVGELVCLLGGGRCAMVFGGGGVGGLWREARRYGLEWVVEQHCPPPLSSPLRPRHHHHSSTTTSITGDCSMVTPEQLLAMPTQQLRTLSKRCIASLPPDCFPLLSRRTVASLPHHMCLRPEQISLLSEEAILGVKWAATGGGACSGVTPWHLQSLARDSAKWRQYSRVCNPGPIPGMPSPHQLLHPQPRLTRHQNTIASLFHAIVLLVILLVIIIVLV
jgi:hypothetical protein